MQHHLFEDNTNIIEVGVDEVGRGPLFGRVYTAAVVLPKGTDFDFTNMKDSKKFHSKKKIEAVSDYIKSNAVAFSIQFKDENIIDDVNILQATQQSMHDSILDVKSKLEQRNLLTKGKTLHLLVDGNYFNPITKFNKESKKFETLSFNTFEKGDDRFSAIAAASILAKVARDQYVEDLCLRHPELIVKYGIDSNKGYGSKKHMDGIKEHGITQWHRKSFKPCSLYTGRAIRNKEEEEETVTTLCSDTEA